MFVTYLVTEFKYLQIFNLALFYMLETYVRELHFGIREKFL